MVGLSLGEQNFIEGGIDQDLRTDGRTRLSYRPIFVETGVIPQARVKLGATEVIASVKAEIHLVLTKERFLYMLTAVRRLSQLLRAEGVMNYRETSLQHYKGVCCRVVKVEKIVSSDGNVLDALGAAIKAALSNTAIPRVQVASNASSDLQPEVDVSDDQEYLQFDTLGVPVIITLTKVGRHCIVDGCNDRRGVSNEFSIHVSEQLINKLDSEIAAAEACEEDDEMES